MLLNADLQWLKKKWETLNVNIAPEIADKWFPFIVSQYTQMHRFYHNLGHVQSLLQYAEKYSQQLKNIPALEWAIWFHDSIYDPQSKENEFNSNQVWLQFVQEAKNIDELTNKTVQAMILGSASHTLNTIPKELLTENDEDVLSFFDFDLSILSSEKSVYKEYAQSIRKEYAHVPEKLYKEGRIKVLEVFLSREIYYSQTFKALEPQAKENMQKELMKLKNI